MDNILVVKNLKKYFPIKKGLLLREVGQVKAVDDVSLTVRRGETLGLVGESGCGKSTLGRAIIRLYEPTAGTVQFDGKDFLAEKGENLRKTRKNLQMIFQDPYASLDPRMTIGQILSQPFEIHNLLTTKERNEKIKELLQIVGLKASHVGRYPHEFSGGQRQRISIARAVALNPSLVIADEPVSALDVSIQAQVLNLMKDLQEKLKLTYIFISHDLSVIEHICDRIAVMYLGKIVEVAGRDELFNNPEKLIFLSWGLIDYLKYLNKKTGLFEKFLTIDKKSMIRTDLNKVENIYFHKHFPMGISPETLRKISNEVIQNTK